MASVYRRKDRQGKVSKYWMGRYKDFSGRWKTFRGWPDKAKTLAQAAQLEADNAALRRGELELPEREKPLAEIVEEYLAWGSIQGGRGGRPWDKRNAKLRAQYLRWWIERLGIKSLNDVKLGTVEKVCAELLERLQPKSVNLRLEGLRALCLWALRRQYIEKDPLVGLSKLHAKAASPHRALTRDEVNALLAAAPPRRRIQYATALATGYRVGELRKIRAKDLDLSGPWLKLDAEFAKNRKDARQPIPDWLGEVLRPMAEERNPECPLLEVAFGSRASSHFTKDAKAAGIALRTPEGVATWHSLRKTYVTEIVQSGADLKTIMELARHSSATLSMEIYAAKDERRMREAVAHVTPVLRTPNTKPASLTAKRVNEMGDTGLEPKNQACDTKEEECQNAREAPFFLGSEASDSPTEKQAHEGILRGFCNTCATQLATRFTAAQWRELAAFASEQAQAMEGPP